MSLAVEWLIHIFLPFEGYFGVGNGQHEEREQGGTGKNGALTEGERQGILNYSFLKCDAPFTTVLPLWSM